MMNRWFRQSLVYSLLAGMLLLASCDRNRVYEKNIHIPGAAWSMDFVPAFTFRIKDSTVFYNFYINLRNNTDYPYSNLFLFVNSYLPDGSSARDTIEMMLANRDGRWLGKGIGKIKESRYLLKQDLLFPLRGEYRIEIEQAMRNDTLTGIEDVGIRIEKADY